MSKLRECRYAVYFNTTDKHINIHKIDCTHLEKHGGEHKYDQGGYGFFITEFDTNTFARGLSRDLDIKHKNCITCKDLG